MFLASKEFLQCVIKKLSKRTRIGKQNFVVKALLLVS
jgi:hypothetical protein